MENPNPAWLHNGPTLTQDEVVVLRTLVDIWGPASVQALLEADEDAPDRDALCTAANVLGSISKKLADCLAYLGDY